MKKQLFKALAATAIVGAVMAVGTVSAFAANIGTSNKSVLTGDVSKAPADAINCTVTKNADSVTYKYEIGAIQEYYGLSFNGISEDAKVNSDKTSYIRFTTDSKFDIKITPVSGKKSNTVTLSAGTDTSNITSDDIIDSSASTSGTSVTKTNNAKGEWSISRLGSGGPYVNTIEITVKAPEPEYEVSGTVSGDDYGNAVISIGSTALDVKDGSYTVNLSNDTYPITISDSLYTVSPETVTVNGKTTCDITVTKKAVTTLTISAPAELGLTGNTIDVKDADGTVVKATKTDAGYEAIVAQGGTYSIDVLADKGYQESAYVIGGYDNIEVGSATSKTVTLTAEKITEWNIADVGKTMPEVTIERVEGTYKGIAVNANKSFEADKTRYGKFASKSGQLNSKTTLTIPLDTDTQELELTVKDDDNIGYTLTYGDGNAVITAGDPNSNNKYSIYIQDIKIVDKKTISESATPVEGKDGFSYAIDKANNTTYVIYGIKDADLENDKLTLTVGTGATAGKAETNEVYTAVQFAEGDTITAGEGAYSDYAALYAVKVTGVTAPAKSDSVFASLE